MGLSGTLETISDFEKNILKDKFNIEKYTVTPSVYGESQLKELNVEVEKDQE